jgi:hypothetical protein
MYVSNNSLEGKQNSTYLNVFLHVVWNTLTKQNSTPLTMNCSGRLGFPRVAFRFLLCGQCVLPHACRHLRLKRLQMAITAVTEIHDKVGVRQLRS